MQTYAKILADSISPEGKRLTSMEVGFHRFILPEVNTHRVLSRGYRSSRAVPVEKLIHEVRTDPAMPEYWGKNQPGMQAKEELTGFAWELAKFEWRTAAEAAALVAEQLVRHNVHKQITNRVLEPYLWVYGVITSTEWDNLFELRCHQDAQPEFRVLAEAMRIALAQSTSKLLQPGDWHLPYIVEADFEALHDHLFKDYAAHGPIAERVMSEKIALISAARCARVSYKLFDGTTSIEADLALAERLMKSKHWSPFEHQATPAKARYPFLYVIDYEDKEQHRNFSGWRQHRALVGG